MKVTTEGEKVIDDLWDVIAAKGFEKDTYFEMAARDIRGLPKLEGTVHVNMALVLKFMANYLFNPAEYPPVPARRDAADDEFLFRQGPARGLGKIQFDDWRPAYAPFADIPNVVRFMEQAEGLGKLLSTAPPSEEQQRELGFLLTLGELFTLVPYGQLILEQAALTGVGRHPRRDLRRAGARLLRLRGDAPRSPLVHRGPAGMGAGPRPQAGRRHGPLRARVGRGPAPCGGLRDAP